MSTFFYPNRDGISKEEFIHFYSQVYYYRNRDLELEGRIEAILKSDTLKREDVVDILRWKVGTTKYNLEEGTVQDRNRSIDVNALLECLEVGREEKEFEKKRPLKEEEIFSRLIEQKGIGPVYAITLLYFLTKGERPIYDKFAHIAVRAIRGDAGFDCLVTEKELQKEIPLKTLEEYKNIYVKQIESIFGDQYRVNRDVDRALWAYGHLFNMTESNSKGSK